MNNRPASLRILLPLLTLALLSPARAEEPPASPLLDQTPLSADEKAQVNATARGLGGILSTKDQGSPVWESDTVWRDYKKELDGRWNYLENVRLQAMIKWGNTELSTIRSAAPRAVFYPFSGPDVIYPDTLFPSSRYLLMAGLEPVGTMPDLFQLQSDGKLGPYLTQIKTSLFTILAASFFRTNDMKTDFNNQLVDGIMPVIAVFLARQGHSIDSLQYVTLDKDGQLHPRDPKTPLDKLSGAPGVQITYSAKGNDGEGEPQVLLYFQTDLGNDGLKSNPGYLRLMHRLGPGVTYLKAASYLLHDGYFSAMRDAILADSTTVVEDDSGIPFKDFDPVKWQVLPYGNYTGPINLFKDKNQPDLTAFYAKSKPAPLPFGSGYKFKADESSLLVVKRK